MTDHNSIPTESVDSTLTPEPKRRPRKRSLLIAAGAAAGALVLAGGGVAIGAAIADEGDDDDDRTASETRSDDDQAAASSSSNSTERGATSADDILRVLDSASEAADGEPTSIDAEDGGAWEVTLHGSDGSETEVRVDADGAATVTSEEAADADDSAPAGVLDRATVEGLVAAALAESDGTILELSVDDGSQVFYDVQLRDAEGRVLDLSLDADFAVVSSTVDD